MTAVWNYINAAAGVKSGSMGTVELALELHVAHGATGHCPDVQTDVSNVSTESQSAPIDTRKSVTENVCREHENRRHLDW